jgi:hypothetical protein
VTAEHGHEKQLRTLRGRLAEIAPDQAELVWSTLESVVAKRRSGRATCPERGWIKAKNRDCCRYDLKRDGVWKVRERPKGHAY